MLILTKVFVVVLYFLSCISTLEGKQGKNLASPTLSCVQVIQVMSSTSDWVETKVDSVTKLLTRITYFILLENRPIYLLLCFLFSWIQGLKRSLDIFVNYCFEYQIIDGVGLCSMDKIKLSKIEKVFESSSMVNLKSYRLLL